MFDFEELKQLIGETKAKEVQVKIDKALGNDKKREEFLELIMDVAKAGNHEGYLDGQADEAYANSMSDV